MTFRQALWDEPLLLKRSMRGRKGYSLPELDETVKRDVGNPSKLIPKKLRRSEIPLPELSEPQVVRHFTNLSQMNFGIDNGPYPLGSCTMKYNPKISERVTSDPKLLRIHPLQHPNSMQGLLQLLYDLSKIIAEITGTDKVTLAPAAGAHGEFAGALMMKAWADDRGESDERTEMLVPDSAHGTNPASATMAGFKVVKIPSDRDGLTDLDAIKAAASNRTVGMMMTNPNTLGLFERNVTEISQIIHDAGGLMYYDGANMNALLGRVRPGDMGFDIVHTNLHKTFSIPHGGGGPGAGPVGVSKELIDYLPIPVISFREGVYFLDYKLPRSIGMIKGFFGNTAHLVRAYVYILSLGGNGLRQVSNHAVLASNYLLSKLDTSIYNIPHSRDIPRKHEFVVSGSPMLKRKGVKILDIGKALLDHGIHSPTVYFPLIVEEALMVEPTETESVENLDNYAAALNKIGSDAQNNPKGLQDAPRNTSIGRLNEVQASHPKTMCLNWRMGSRKTHGD